ncbi:MAG: FAD-dependent oxidoreductase [Sandaracinobacter sp.]
MKRLLLLLGLVVAAVLAWRMGLFEFLTLDALKARQSEFQALYAARPLLVLAGFFALYVAVTGLSLPGAAILTLAAGALFGLFTGTILVSFASTIGATLSFLAARYLFRRPVEARFGDRLGAINRGLEKDGAFYLFTLRLVPIFPFFLINLLMGLTRIRTSTFAWVSQIGMLAGTIVYVNAGTELAKIDSLSGIASPGLLLSFVALGIFPWIAKSLVNWLARRRVQAKWRRPARYDRNLMVIGGGAAGLVTAYVAAAVKAKVILIESHAMGGDCLNTGCVPSKALLASAKRASEFRSADKLGIRAQDPDVDFPAVMARVRSVIATIEPHDSVERYQSLGVDARIGHATLIDPWTVEIRTAEGAERLTTRAIALATGAKPIIPPIPGLADAPHLTSETLWDAMAKLPAPPARLTVLGGGPIGCELAQAFHRLGSKVTLVEGAPRLLGREEPEASAAVAQALAADGVDLRLGQQAEAVEAIDGGWALKVGGALIPHDALLIAVGRTARTEGFGLEALGIPAGKVIETNDWLETLHPNIYAVGDAAGPFQLTHAASHQAWHAAVNALFGTFRRFRVDYSVMPAATYTDPEVARVGLTVAEAGEKGTAVEVTSLPMARFDRALAEGATLGFVQLITAKGKDRILGATIVGQNAGELIAPIALAMRHKLGLMKLMGTIHAYPTLAEGAKLTAGEWRRKTAPQGLLKCVERYHDWRRG